MNLRTHGRMTAAAALASMLVLGGCTAEEVEPSPDRGLPRINLGFEPVAVPKALQGTAPSMAAQVLLDPVGSGPASVVTRAILPNGSTSIQVRRPTTSASPVDLTVPEAVSVEAASSDEAAVIGGSRVVDRRRSMWVKVSTDRTTWRDLPLDKSAASLGLSAVGVVGTRVLLVGRDTARADWLSVGNVGKAGTFAKLPPPDKGQEATITTVAGQGNQILAIRAIGPRGGDTLPHALVSSDSGKTWTTQRIPGFDGIAGVRWTGTAYVATGWVRTRGADEFVAAAASSTDGRTWKAESLPPVPKSSDLTRTRSYLSAPALSAGAVQAQFGCTCVSSLVAQRAANGTWTWQGETTRSHETGIPALAWREAQGSVLSVLDRSSLKVYRSTPVTEKLTPTTLVAAREVNSVDDVVDLGNLDLVTTSRSQVNITQDSWARTTLPISFTYTPGTGITENKEALTPFSRLSGVSSARGPDSQVVAIGSSFSTDSAGNDKWGVTSLSRKGDSGAWVTGKGLNLDGFTQAADVVRAGKFWYAALTTAASGNYTDPRRGRIARSTDGVNWTSMSGDWLSSNAGANAGSSINDLCLSPKGAPIAVGSVTTSDRKLTHAATWTLAKDTWTFTAYVDKDGSGSSFSRCTSTGSSTVISGSVQGRNATWTSPDGVSFSTPTLVPENQVRGNAEAFGDVVLAPGAISTPNDVGAVIWVSGDGSRWRSMNLPKDVARSSSVTLKRAGNDALVIADNGNGTQAWRLTGLPTPSATPSGSVSSSP